MIGQDLFGYFFLVIAIFAVAILSEVMKFPKWAMSALLVITIIAVWQLLKFYRSDLEKSKTPPAGRDTSEGAELTEAETQRQLTAVNAEDEIDLFRGAETRRELQRSENAEAETKPLNESPQKAIEN